MRATFTRRVTAQSLTALAAVVAVAFLAPVPSATGSVPTADKPAQKKAQGELQTYGIGPANADGLDRRGAFVYAGRPGTVVKDQFALVNYTTKPRTVRVYASDAFTTDSGVYDLLAADKKPTDIGSWTNLKPRTVTIPARKTPTSVKPGTVVIPFTLKVPAGAAPGDHAGGFVVSVRTDAAKATNSVVVDRRVGTRVYMQVEGPLDPRLEVTGLTATYEGTFNPVATGTTHVRYVVENKGNVVLSARQSTKVDTWISDASPATAQADLLQLLPGAKVNVAVDVPGTWPTFRPTAKVTLVPYTGLPESPTLRPAVTASTSFWAIPWTVIAIVVGLILALLGWLYLRRRRSLTPPPSALEIPELVDAP